MSDLESENKSENISKLNEPHDEVGYDNDKEDAEDKGNESAENKVNQIIDAENKNNEIVAENGNNETVAQNKNNGDMGFAELIYGILFSPVSTFRRISDEPPLLHGFFVFIGVVVVTSVVNTLAPLNLSSVSPQVSGAMAKAGPFLGIIGALVGLVSWFMQAGIFQLFAEFFGGRGRAVGVLTVIALADLPRILVAPVQVISYFAANTFIGKFLTITVSILVFVWWIVLLVIGLREIHKFTTGRAIATLLIPLGILIVGTIILLLATIGVAAPFLGAGQ